MQGLSDLLRDLLQVAKHFDFPPPMPSVHDFSFRDLSQLLPKLDGPRWPVNIQHHELWNQAALVYFWANSLPSSQLHLESPLPVSLAVLIQSDRSLRLKVQRFEAGADQFCYPLND